MMGARASLREIASIAACIARTQKIPTFPRSGAAASILVAVRLACISVEVCESDAGPVPGSYLSNHLPLFALVYVTTHSPYSTTQSTLNPTQVSLLRLNRPVGPGL